MVNEMWGAQISQWASMNKITLSYFLFIFFLNETLVQSLSAM